MLQVFLFELRYQLRSPLFLILATVFFVLAFMLMASEDIRLGGVGSNTHLNAAWTIVYTQFFFSIIGMLASIAIVSQAITRDYELKTAEILFATGVAESHFLLGRFWAGSVCSVLVGAAALLGTLCATFMPWLDQERVGAFMFAPYVYGFLVVTVPNLFVSGALFFTVAALTRSMIAAFSGAVGFLVLNIVISTITDAEKLTLLAMVDPFGSTAFAEVSRYWTVFERNTALVPVTGNMLYNRLLWVGLGVLALLYTIWRYGFTLNPSPFQRLRRKPIAQIEWPVIASVSVTLRFGAGAVLSQVFSQARVDLAGIYKSVPFYALLGFAVLNVLGGFASSGASLFGIPLFPTTGTLLRAITSSYTLFVLMIIIYYAGEVVHRERLTGVSEVADAMPFPNGVMIAGKVLAMWFIVAALLLFALLAGVVWQVLAGYTNFEVLLYIQGLFVLLGGFYFTLCVFAVFVQVLAGNKWLGMVALLGALILFSSLDGFGFEHALYNFGPPFGLVQHSDMNGYGHFWPMILWLTLYWTLFCVILAVVSHAWFRRGHPAGFAQQLRIARGRLTAPVLGIGVVAFLGFAASGAWIFHNTNVLNAYQTTSDREALQAAYEKGYKQYQLMSVPQVDAVESFVDLYPAERRLESRGTVTLTNHSDQIIRETLIGTDVIPRINQLALTGAVLVDSEPDLGVYRYEFAAGLAPGATTTLTYDLTWHHQGFANPNVQYNRVVANGTFVNNVEILPVVGYNTGLELTDPNVRREQGLAPIVRLPELGDPDWLNISQFGVSRRTAFKTTISTSADQIAVAPGYQVGEVVEAEGRRTYVYAMDDAIWPFFSFVSARYEVARDQWQDVAIEVYYDAKHPYNIEPMLRGTKKSLDYFSREFSPYQYRQFRILEFPRYARFAQSFPNTIPFSESIGFVADLTDEHSLDLVFYVTAHELAHQWWGHQVAGARMQGMTVIVETLAQYSALMVMEREYGPDKMRRFLRYELDRYLQSRGSEQIEELPLVYSENQPYIHYQKGSLAMYALKDAIGEDNVNLALRQFLDKFAFGTGPFPTSLDLVAEFRAVADTDSQALITDLFEKITLYDLSVTDTEVTEIDGEWEVRLTTRARQVYANGSGEETPADIDTWADIAVFPASEEELEEYQLPPPLYFQKHRVTGDGEVVIRVSERPHRVGIDPYNKLIDRNPEDNLKTI